MFHAHATPAFAGRARAWLHIDVRAGSVRLADSEERLLDEASGELGGLELGPGRHAIPWSGAAWLVTSADAIYEAIVL